MSTFNADVRPNSLSLWKSALASLDQGNNIELAHFVLVERV